MAEKLYTQADYNKKAVGVEVPGLQKHTQEVQSNVAPVEPTAVAPVVPEEEPGFLETAGAAFNTSNFMVGLWHDLETDSGEIIDSNYVWADHADDLMQGVPEEYRNRLIASRSLESALKEKDSILKELADKDTLRKAGFVGTALEFGVLIADAPTLLSGFGEVYALANLAVKGRRIRNMVTGGLIGAGAAMGQEAALASVTHTRDTEDLLYAGVFGLGIGTGVGAFLKGSAAKESAALLAERQKLSKEILDDLDAKLAAETPMEYLTREQAEELAAKGVTPNGYTRPKEQAKATVLRSDIAEMKAARSEEIAGIHAEHGVPKTPEETKLLDEKIGAVDTTWTPMIEQAEAKLSAIDERLGTHVNTETRVQDILNKHKLEADAHNARIKELELKRDAAKSDYLSLHVPDFDVYDELGEMTAEWVNGVKGSYKQVVQNDGSTTAMFVPWTGSARKKAGAFSDLTDKKAKVEISDRDAVFTAGKSGETLGSMLHHPELFDAMPELKDVPVYFTKGENYYSPRDKALFLDREKPATLHEIQHLVQDEGDFALGGNPGQFTSAWVDDVAGAAEANAAEIERLATEYTDLAAKQSAFKEKYPTIKDVIDAGVFTEYQSIEKAINENLMNRARMNPALTTKSTFDRYTLLAGEEEARRTAKRVNLLDDVRVGDPYHGTDVPNPSDLIVKRSSGGSNAAMASEDVLDSAGNVVPKPRDIVADAAELEAKGVFKKLEDSKVGRALLKLGFTDSSWLLSQKSPVSKLFSREILSNGVTGGAGSAAVEKFQHLKVMLSSFMPDLTASYKQFAHRKGISHWNLKKYYGEGMEDWNRELRMEMEQRRNAFRDEVEHVSTASKEIQDAADALQRTADHALDVARSKGVRGFEDIAAQPGYVPLIHSGRALRKLGNGNAAAHKIEVDAYTKLYSEGYTKAIGITKEDADKIAKAVISRALHKDLGIDANPRALFNADSRNFLRETLEEGTGMSQKEIDELFARIDARQGDKGMSARAKRRTDIDLLVTDAEGRSLLDVVDNDIPTLFTRYSSEMSGRAALAAKGISSDADWTRLRNTLIEQAAIHGDDYEKLKKVIDSTYDQFLGRPAGGGVNKNARRLMDMASAAVLNQIGFAQMAEWAQIMASHGIAGMFEMMPAIREYRAALKAGTLSDDVLSELSVHTGRIGQEEMLFRPDIRLNDKLSDDPAWLRILDKGLGSVNNISGKLSMMHQIKTMQQQFVVALQANKVAKAVVKGDWNKLSSRFAELGWDDQFMRELKEASKHFEFDERGTLQRLNLQNWKNPGMTEKFIQGLHIHTNQMIQMPFIGETAYWMHNTVGAMLTQFRTFPLVAMEKQTARHMMLADEEAVFVAMYGLGLSALVYTAKVGLNAQGKGSEKSKYLDDRLSISAIAKGAFQYANVAGPIQDVSNLMVAAGLAPKIMSSSNVGRTGGDKQANLSLSDVPSLGTGLKLFNAATGMGKGLLNPDYNYSKKDLNNVQGAMPLGNTPFLTIPWNMAKDSVD